MKLKITLYSVCLLMLLAACQQDGPTPEPSVGSRTVLVYMIAQNSLAPLASADIEEMKEGMRQVDATSGNLLVYFGSPADSSGKRQKRKSGGRDH